MTTREATAKVLKRIRKRRRMSQETMGKRIGIHRNTVSRIEAGEASPEIDVVCAWATAANCTLGEVAMRIERKLHKRECIPTAPLEVRGIVAE